MKPFVHYVPAAFCAFLSILALVGSVGAAGKWWSPAYYAFLPMCFFLVGANSSRTSRELKDLRERVLQLEQMRSDDQRTMSDDQRTLADG